MKKKKAVTKKKRNSCYDTKKKKKKKTMYKLNYAEQREQFYSQCVDYDACLWNPYCVPGGEDVQKRAETALLCFLDAFEGKRERRAVQLNTLLLMFQRSVLVYPLLEYVRFHYGDDDNDVTYSGYAYQYQFMEFDRSGMTLRQRMLKALGMRLVELGHEEPSGLVVQHVRFGMQIVLSDDDDDDDSLMYLPSYDSFLNESEDDHAFLYESLEQLLGKVC